jgi:uncharacterized membrane protein
MVRSVGETVVLTIHVAAGVAGLLLGPVAMVVEKRRGRHTALGETYHVAFVVLITSAVTLAVINWSESWWLALVATGSYAFALLGYLAAKRRSRNWLPMHVAGVGGSYIAMTSATLVVNWENLAGIPGRESPLPWVLPTLIGTPLLVWLVRQIEAGRRPRRRVRVARR